MIYFPEWVTGPTRCKTITHRIVLPRGMYLITRHGAIIVHMTTWKKNG